MDETLVYVETKDIPGYEAFPGWRVGSDGSVQSCWERVWDTGGKGCRSEMTERWHDMHPCSDDGGYLVFTIRNKTKQRTAKVHVLVCTAFHGPKPFPKAVAAHYPDKKTTNNAASNLMWTDHQGNSDHMKEHGTVLCGSNSPVALTDERTVYEMRLDYEGGMTIPEIAEEYDMLVSTTGYIINGTTWTHVVMPDDLEDE